MFVHPMMIWQRKNRVSNICAIFFIEYAGHEKETAQDAISDMRQDIGKTFTGFQKYFYNEETGISSKLSKFIST